MDCAGFGGAQVFLAHPLSKDDPKRGIGNFPLFSETSGQRFVGLRSVRESAEVLGNGVSAGKP